MRAFRPFFFFFFLPLPLSGKVVARAAGGTEDMLRAFVHSFETDPSAMLGAFAPLPLAAPLRHAALVSLQAAVKARARPLAGAPACMYGKLGSFLPQTCCAVCVR